MAKEFNFFEQNIDTLQEEQSPLEDSVSPIEMKSESLSQNEQLITLLEKVKASQSERENISEARKKTKHIIEALLFASHEPISFQKIREIVDAVYPFKPKELFDIIKELEHDYIVQERAFRLEEIAQGFILRTLEEYSSYIDLLYRSRRGEKLSQASAEVLAIIAYKQPVTRAQIEAIRGVDSSGIIYTLLERQLIEVTGKLEAPGRPSLYCITKDFLKHFGLKDLKDLPHIELPRNPEHSMPKGPFSATAKHSEF